MELVENVSVFTVLRGGPQSSHVIVYLCLGSST